MVDYGNVVMWQRERTLKYIGVQLSLNFSKQRESPREHTFMSEPLHFPLAEMEITN
jgi:hypothetical protein